MDEKSSALPDECWAMIFNKIHQGIDWESISLVCKRFLSIANSTQVSLAVTNPSIEVLSRVLHRFNHLKKIQLVGFLGDLNEAVLAIARSGLNLEELDLSGNVNLPTVRLEELGAQMKNLKVLMCSYSSLTDIDLVRIAESFPQLEEVDISESCFPHTVDDMIIAVTDHGIKILSSKIKGLKKINLSGNQCISDESLICLSQNCVFLEDIKVGYCDVTETGISFVIHNSHHLKSLVLSAHFKLESFFVKGSTIFPRNLKSVNLTKIRISDEFLKSIAEVGIPLRDFTLSFCKGYTFNGIKTLLHSYPLKSFVLLGAEFLTDEHIQKLPQFLQSLTKIWLHNCPKLTDYTFLILTERCPQLKCLQMGETSLGIEQYNYEYGDSLKNFAVTSLKLSWNRYLSNYVLRKLFHICPSVEKIHLTNCFQREEELDVADILKYNSEIKSLMLDGCQNLKISRRHSEVSELQRLTAKYSGINDEVLAMIGRTCPKLVHLDLEDCKNITEVGVQEVVRSCKRLRYLGLCGCSTVDPEIIYWLVSTRPSLRRIVSSSHLYPSEEQQKNFLRQGCLVYKGRDYEEFI